MLVVRTWLKWAPMALAVGLAACSDEPTAPVNRPAVAAVDVTPSALALTTGDTIRLLATPRASGGTPLPDRTVTWSSSDTSVATVAATGLVHARLTGTAEIRALVEGRTGRATLTVTDPVATPPAVIRMSPTTTVAGSGALTLSVFGAAFAAGAEVLWDNAPRPTTRVSATELRAAIGAQDLASARTVPVAVRNPPPGGISEQIAFVITPVVGQVPVDHVTVTPDAAELPERGTTQLHAAAYAADSTALADRPFTWTSLGPATATVDQAGRVTAHRIGQVRIRVESEGKAAHAVIDVIPGVDRVTVTPTQAVLSEGRQIQLEATAYALDGSVLTGRAFTWTSSAQGTATVDETGTVTARHVGVVLITAESEGRGASARIEVVVPVGHVIVNPFAAAVLAGSYVQLQAKTYSSTGGELQGRAISWSSEDPATATVDAQGLVLGVKKGTTRVFAESEGKVGWSTVEVRQYPDGPTHIYELRGLLDSGFMPSVGDTTWVDDQGTAHQGTLFLRGGILKLHTDQSRYEQDLVIDVFVPGPGFVGQAGRSDHGDLAYNFPTGGYVFTSAVTQTSFTGSASGNGELIVEQAIGTAPKMAYRWVLQ